jgi:hypothetical protein
VFTSRCLATAVNNVDSSASVLISLMDGGWFLIPHDCNRLTATPLITGHHCLLSDWLAFTGCHSLHWLENVALLSPVNHWIHIQRPDVESRDVWDQTRRSIELQRKLLTKIGFNLMKDSGLIKRKHTRQKKYCGLFHNRIYTPFLTDSCIGPPPSLSEP